MNTPMTPSLVLTDYNILGRRFPKDLIAETRERFKQLESDGIHPWRILVDEVMLEEERTELPEVEQKLAEDRLWIAQACAEVMLKKVNRNVYLDRLNWPNRIIFLNAKESYYKLFSVLNISANIWIMTKKIEVLHSGLCYALKKKHQTWNEFLNFMEVSPESRIGFWKQLVERCETRQDYLELFEGLNIQEVIWKNSAKMAEEYGALQKTLQKKHQTWNDFLDFMEVSTESRIGYWKKLVERCETRQDYLELFEGLNISDLAWRSSEQMNTRHVGICVAIIKRHGKYSIFKAIMDGHLPFNDFTSPTEAQACLRQEVLRLRAGGKWIQEPTADNCITQAEWHEIAQEDWYKKNAVVKAVTDFISSKE